MPEAPAQSADITTPEPSSADSLTAALGKGFALKAAGKLTVDDPNPPGLDASSVTHGTGTDNEGDTPPPERSSHTSPAPTQRVAPRPSQTPAPGQGETLPPAKLAVTAERRKLTADDWKQVNEERHRLREQVTALEAKQKEWETRQSQLDELPKVKARADELDKILRQVAAERHPELIGPIQTRMKAAIDLARSVVPKDQADSVASLLLQPDSDMRDSALEEVLEGLKSVKRSKLERAIGEFDSAVSERGQLASRSQEAFTQRQEQLRQQHAANVAQFDAELKDWTDPAHGIEMLVEKAGDAAHNERRQAILDNARALFSGEVTNVRDLARAAVWSSFGEALATQNKALLGEVKRLTDEITALKGGGPGLENTTTTEAGEADAQGDTKPDDMSTAEWVVQQAKREGVAFGRGGF